MHTLHWTLPTHPRTGLRAVGIVKGRPVWPILGGSGEGDGGEGSDGGQQGGGTATYTPPASQEELNRIIEQRLSRERAKYQDYDVLKEKAAKHDALELELASDLEKATKKARDEARAEALREATPRMVRAEFKAAAKGVLSDEQSKALMEFLDEVDTSKYLTADGEVDEEKISKRVAAFAPAKGSGNGAPPRPLGQGHQTPASPSARDLGRAEAEKRFGKKQ